MNSAVLVLNQNYEPLNVCSIRRAIVLVFAGKADVLEQQSALLHTTSRVYSAPSVIRLRMFVRRPRPHVRLSRREIFIRDNFICQYCGCSDREMTVDHVIPRSRGGRHEWTNVVTCCKMCNHRKGNKSVQDAHMALRSIPIEPRPGIYYSIERRLDLSRQPTWMKFLPGIELSAISEPTFSDRPAMP